MATTPAETYVITSDDPALEKVYGNDLQNIPVATGNVRVTINNTTDYITQVISNPGEPAGNTGEVQFNYNGGLTGDAGFTYEPVTDSLTVAGNVAAGYIKTNSLLYANGANWNFGAASYSNSNVANYLPTYTGNFAGNVITANSFSGNGSALTNIAGGNVSGSVANATYANAALLSGTVTTNAQPNITSVGTLTSVSVTGNVSSGNANLGNLATANFFSGSGNLLSNIQGANVVGAVASATSATTATSATSATTAGTVTSNSQPNVTSIGTLNSVTATGVVNFTGSSNVSLGPVGNVKITGGTSGQYLQTNGSGTLSWADLSVSNLYSVTNAGNTTNVALSLTNTTESLSFSTGAVTISGGLGVAKAIHTDSHVAARNTVYAGQYADFSSWVVPKFIGRDAGSTYIQGALINTTESGSADWVAYNDASPTDGTEAWVDMGFTGSNFSDPLYTITKANDGYVFAQGLNGVDGGNLVLATGEIGDHHDLIFATGGFLEANEAMRLDHERDTFFVGGHAHTGLSDRVIDLDVNGNIIVSGNIDASVSASPAPSINGFSSAEFVDSLTVGNITISNNLINTNSNATSLLLSANYPASSNALIEIPNFIDGGEKLTIRNDFTNSNGIDIQTSGGIWTFSATGLLEFPGNARIDSSGDSFEVQNANVVNFEAVNTVSIYTDSANNGHQWQFGDDANLTLPGALLGTTANNDGYLQWVGNSSGDGSGYTTMNLVPDNTLTGTDQYLIIDPTSGGHIHIRAGGTQDNSSAQLYLGGENSHVSVGATANPPVYIKANSYQWTYGTDGNLTLPGNTFAVNYANGTQVTLGGSYGDSNVVTLLSSFGSNTISTTGNVAAGAVTASGKIGYSAGANVTQTGSRSSSVTINGLSGEITLVASSMAAGDVNFFTVTNNQLEVGDMIICTTYAGSAGTYLPMAFVSSATQAVFTFRNLDSFVTASESPVIKFIVVKAPKS